MNGEPLSSPHGYPLRLIVPGWYAVASVKWLTEIVVTDRAFEGHYQKEKYWYRWVRNGREERWPVTLMNVRALIGASPDEGESLPRGETAIRGVAWSGAGSISRVECKPERRPVAARRGSWANGGAVRGNGGSWSAALEQNGTARRAGARHRHGGPDTA